MIRPVVTLALTISLTATACWNEPDFGSYENVIVHGPAAAGDDAPRMDVVTFRQGIDGRPQTCFGLTEEPGHLSGTCLAPGDVPELDEAVFAHTEGSAHIALGLVTTAAAVVQANLRDDTTIEMTPYRHPDLQAGVFAFSIPEEANIMTIEARDGAGQVLGSYGP